MTERRTLDPESLTAPVAGTVPAGEPLPASTRRRLEDARRVVDPATFAATDPRRPPVRSDPDWADIAALCTSVLTSTSKDLNVAARLCEAWTELHGFAGLAAGVRLLRLLVEECWDRTHPEATADDPEARALPLLWIADPTHGARFPVKVRLVPLFVSDTVRLSWQFWRDAQAKRTKTEFDLDKFLRAVTRDECRTRVGELEQCGDELARLGRALGERMGDAAPGLTALATVVEDCLGLARHAHQRKSAPAAPKPAPKPKPAPAPARLSFAPPTDREDVLQQLQSAADGLQALEPHSPVPHILFWAIGLARLPVADAVRDLLPDYRVLDGRAPGSTDATPPTHSHEEP